MKHTAIQEKLYIKKLNLIPDCLEHNFWLISADMGYGHQRAIYPLRALANKGKVLNLNVLNGSSSKVSMSWRRMQKLYELFSRAGKAPIIGSLFKGILDKLLFIPKYYPFKNRSEPSFQVKYLRRRISKGLCDEMIRTINNPELPLITSFYLPAIAADMSGHKNVYCIICDTDINRIWVSETPSRSGIVYFASGTESANRLRSYGVPEKNIILTGFPLPIELLGDRSLDTLKTNLNLRLQNLDPLKSFHNLYKYNVKAFLGNEEIRERLNEKQKQLITITYTTGGAGAQKEIGKQIAQSLLVKIRENKVRLNLVAGTRKDVRDYYIKLKEEITNNHMNVKVIWGEDNESYFELFNKCLHTTDILWTKPSELSFYCALGIPIIMTPAIGPQEKFNRRWLKEIGAGIKQKNPLLTDQWLFDLLENGRLAEAAWLGFLKARKYGTYKIIDYLEYGRVSITNDPMKR